MHFLGLYSYSTSQVRVTTFQVLRSHTGLVATAPDSTEAGGRAGLCPRVTASVWDPNTWEGLGATPRPWSIKSNSRRGQRAH